MKVRINETIEVDDEALSKLADLAEGRQNRRKATRIEARTFIRNHGCATWPEALERLHTEAFGEPEDEVEDLLGELI